MRTILMRLLVVFVLVPSCAVSVVAGPLEDGLAAYQRGDHGTAIQLWRPLAEINNAPVQTILSIMYRDGLGVPRDSAESVKWLRRAVEQNFAPAQTYYGDMNVLGRDYAEAVKWYRLAAEQGDPSAQTRLGIMYRDRLGVPQDHVVAHMWLSLATTQGDEVAAESLKDVSSQMTPNQIAEAQRLERQWKRRFR